MNQKVKKFKVKTY